VRASSPRRLTLRFAVAATTALMLVSVAAPTAFAQPANDNFADATIVSSLPFSTSVDLSGATTEPDEPLLCGAQQTVWYSFTPTSDAVVRAEATGSNFSDTNLSIYRADGPGLGNLTWLGCGSFGSPVVFDAQVGTTYYIQGGSFFGQGGTLGVHLEVVPPPPNDDFANAISYTGPFSDTQDITGATTQAGEPPSSCLGGLTNTIWYSFTPTTSGPISADTEASFVGDVAVYTGTSLGTLTELGCSRDGGFFNFHADAGTTYYFQAGSHGLRGSLQLNVIETPPPAAAFAFSPTDPSIFDTIEFVDLSTDPFVGIQSSVWDFGDGTTAEGCCPTHRYSADGDYTVQLTVTTPDGRTASTSQVVQVRTHDVAVVRIAVPKSAHVGQTITITAHVRNTRYPETVQVDLFKSVPGGFEQVGSLTQSVPVRPGNRTTQFTIAYTITQADGTVGKVSFKAVATIIDHRDALPADNELISPPVKVT
jgi:hypothetical protein